MAAGWTAGAKAAMQAGCPVETTAHIDVEQNGTGVYGTNIVDITAYVAGPWPRLKKASSAIRKNWEVSPIILRVDNSSDYFTPNLCGVGKAQITNIWQTRAAGEAEFRECKVYVKQTLTLADGTTETLTRYKGMIIDLTPIIDAKRMLMEIVVRDQLLDALDRVFEIGDGGSTYVDTVL